MAFANLTLLIGGLLMAVPIVLHLTMRQQPRRMKFPALQFVKRRRDTNRRTLQLRQWLLLLLRCLAILMVAAALARPSVGSAALGVWLVVTLFGGLTLLLGAAVAAAIVAGKGRWLIQGLGAATAVALVITLGLVVRAATAGAEVTLGNQEAPVAAVLVFDTSPRLQYRQANRTRLEQAQETALWVLSQLPDESQVAVVEARPGRVGFSVDRAAARRSIERLDTSGLTRSLPQVIEQALDLTAESPLDRKEIYLFSDLTRPAWVSDRRGTLAKRLAELPKVLVYVVDVGVKDPQDFRLGRLRISTERLARNEPLELEAEIQHVGPGGTRTVEMFIERQDASRPMIRDGEILVPAADPRGRELFDLEAGGGQTAKFVLNGLPSGTHHGQLRISGGTDGLASDDVQHFAVEVADAWPILVVAPPTVNSSFFVEAVSPFERRESGQARFECTVIRPADLPNRNLADFEVVCFLDPPPLTPVAWEQLERFARTGGGVAMFLGFQAAENPAAFNVEAAQKLLPGPLDRQWRTTGSVYLAPTRYDHPILAEFQPIATQVPWDQFPVFRHWGLGPLNDGTRVLLRYGNGQPAILESTLEEGRILTLTTPITEPARPSGRQAWNELAGPDDWPRFVLLNEMLLYLVDTGDTRLNYVVGDTVELPNSQQQPDRYQLFAPPGETREVAARDGRLVIRGTERVGAYRLKGNRGGPVLRGFAVNHRDSAGDLQRIEPGELDAILGPQRYQLARQRQEIEVGVGRARVGYPFFPFLMIAVIVLMGLENLLANRFYKRQDGGETEPLVAGGRTPEPARRD